MRSLLLAFAYALVPALATCGDPTADPPSGASSAAVSTSASAPGSSASAAPSASPSVAPGSTSAAFAPPRTDLPKEEREREVARLLAGEADAQTLPLADTEPGEAFDPILRRALAMQGVVKLGDITADGAGPPDLESVRAAIIGRMSKLRGCYVTGLASNPNLIGAIRLGALLAGAGKPKSVENIGSDLPDGEMVACAIAEVGRISFPSPTSGESRVTIRMSFAPGP